MAIPESPQLTARLAAARARRAEERVQYRELVINERDNRPWKPDHYRHVFAAIVIATAAGVWRDRDGAIVLALPHAAARASLKYLPGIRALASGEQRRRLPAGAEWLVEPMPSLAGFRDQDLRDTAVTWLAMAGCTVPEIAAVTGHTLESITTVLKHYLARHPEMADHAIAKLISWHG